MAEREIQQPPQTTQPPPATTTADATTVAGFSSTGPLPATAAVSQPGTQPAASASDRAFGAPQTGQPEIDPTREAMGKHMTAGMDEANLGPHSVTAGIHYWYNYQAACERAGQPDLWKDNYRLGHTQAEGFVQPYESNAFMDWSLKPGHSASKALKAWLKGATVAECLSTVIALQIDTLRASIGDAKFDKLFGSANAAEDAQISNQNRMHIRAGLAGTPVANYLSATKLAETAGQRGGEFGGATNEELERELVPGQWYYFYNHPKYLLKHPGGAWQGENALYMGKNGAGERMWSGLGATESEDHMIDEMVRAYNSPRNDYDKRMLKEGGILQEDGSFTDKSYDPNGGVFPERVTKKEILESQTFAIGDTTRKGGLMVSSGQELDPNRVAATRNKNP